MHQQEGQTAQQILNATEKLMAEKGLHTLSMQKIASAVGISVGTIYIHFKNKDELLRDLAKYLFTRINRALSENCDAQTALYDQYRQMWWNLWHFCHEHEYVLKNIFQYKNIPGFSELVKECKVREDHWDRFVKAGKKQKQLCNLPAEILFSLSLESAMNLSFRQVYFNEYYNNELLEQVIKRTWQAISF
ncbi:TetR/AcrR family transcriptional regulator [Spirabiliibacterium falconis]|uniref:TetR/AcrR family transcriptional regulator n=1 Tax=Spirabiliibacterium falconis TaxID=572023 RepID=UPI001AAD6208|nr:TetR/AcrR family transcriptional regulator [Spirabiliibacterium falconis]MBE2894622.1 TetR/AcrR family transcriptional regulator [Spirabiliibacterium falconis]